MIRPLIAILAAFAAAGAPAQQAYPSKPIRIVAPFEAGGATDIMARMIAQKFAESLGQPVIIDNRPGAGGGIGTAAVAKSPADGYTIVFGNLAPNAINPSIYTNLQYDAGKDFAPISVVATVPLVLVTPSSSPARSVRELIALAQSAPGELNFGSPGVGSVAHVVGEMFNTMAGTRLMHVPYKGGAPAVRATLTGEVAMMFATVISAKPHIRSGKLRALGITSAERSPVAPDIPTIAESGLPGFEVDVWFGLLAPAATPRAIVERLAHEVRRALDAPDVRAKFAELSAVPSPTTPDQFAAIIRADIAKWAKVVKESGAKIE